LTNDACDDDLPVDCFAVVEVDDAEAADEAEADADEAAAAAAVDEADEAGGIMTLVWRTTLQTPSTAQTGSALQCKRKEEKLFFFPNSFFLSGLLVNRLTSMR
jgi:hypothetical protein